jgi:hypothetical protein
MRVIMATHPAAEIMASLVVGVQSTLDARFAALRG